MPFVDRDDFQAWLGRHHAHYADHPPASSCGKCGGPIDREVSRYECVPCLAEQFGVATVESWIADIGVGLVRAADDRVVLAQAVGEIVRFGRDVFAFHLPAPAAAN